MAFSGQDGFVWGIGVVEDRFDPQQLGRVRVRWLGYHSEDKTKILTKDLPWAQVMQSVGGASMAGIGEAPVNLVEGTWVCGFFSDTGWMDDAVVIGTLPGMNTTTALSGEGSRKWAQNRGAYKEFPQSQLYGAEGDQTIPGSEEKYSDYQFGFFDPTYDQSKIPHPPSELTFGSLTGALEQKYIEFDYTNEKLFPRVLNWSPELIQDITHQDAPSPLPETDAGSDKALSEIINVQEWTNDPPLMETGPASTSRITHSDLLHAMFKTTRRVVSDARLPTSWTKMGTMMWPDTMTYSKDGLDQEPFFRIGELEENPDSLDTKLIVGINRLKGVDRQNYIITTGFLEDGFWRNSDGRPTYPWARDRAENSNPTIGTGQFGQSTEWYRVTHPRVKYVAKKDLTPTQEAQAKALYDAGFYGTGIYEMDDPDHGRQDIKWDDVKLSDLVVVQTPDMNPLAMGGIPIESVSGNTVTTKSGFFTTAATSMGANTKPAIEAGDIVQVAGVRGMQEINGRVFKAISASGTSSLTVALGTADGTAWTGPGDTALITTTFSEYINGGVLIVNPHPVLQWKSDIRERQINIGSPDPETGLNAKHWNQPTSDFNAQYPFNQVYESESGHIKEFDDTPGGERIHEYHRAGTFYEIDHAGNKTDYVKGDRYDISMHDDYVYVKGRVVHTYDDEVLIRCNDRLDLSAKWKMQIWSGGDLDIHSKRNINLKSDGDINLQADGHINMQGTTLTADEAKFKAGTRGVYEMSKIKMKAGHLEAEMVGDEAHPDLMGIALQSNIAPIQIKTVQEGKSIFITSAEDIEMFANVDFYRTAWTGKMYDYVYTDYNLTSVSGDLEILAAGTTNTATEAGGDIRITAKQQMDIEACKKDLNIMAGWKDVNILAACASDPPEVGGNINMKSTKNAIAGSGEFSITADNVIEIESVNKNVNITATKDADGNVNIKAGEDIFVDAADVMNVKSGGVMNTQSGGIMNIKGGGNIQVTGGSEIHLNGPTAGDATAATGATPTAPDEAAIAVVGKPAYIAETMTLLVTDIPNPIASDPPLIDEDSHGLALNLNNLTGGGGENIRNLQDLISNIDVAHAFIPSVDVGAQVNLTGVPTTTSAGIWDGYSDQLEDDIYTLGKRAFSNERRFHGWIKEDDKTPVIWKCVVDSTR